MMRLANGSVGRTRRREGEGARVGGDVRLPFSSTPLPESRGRGGTDDKAIRRPCLSGHK